MLKKVSFEIEKLIEKKPYKGEMKAQIILFEVIHTSSSSL